MVKLGGFTPYLSPEIIGTLKYDSELDAYQAWGPQSDMWAVGVIMFYLLCGEHPFEASNNNELR